MIFDNFSNTSHQRYPFTVSFKSRLDISSTTAANFGCLVLNSVIFALKLDPLSVSAVYSVPEVAGVGLTEGNAKEQGIDYESGVAILEQYFVVHLGRLGWYPKDGIPSSRPPLTWSTYPW